MISKKYKHGDIVYHLRLDNNFQPTIKQYATVLRPTDKELLYILKEKKPILVIKDHTTGRSSLIYEDSLYSFKVRFPNWL